MGNDENAFLGIINCDCHRRGQKWGKKTLYILKRDGSSLKKENGKPAGRTRSVKQTCLQTIKTANALSHPTCACDPITPVTRDGGERLFGRYKGDVKRYPLNNHKGITKRYPPDNRRGIVCDTLGLRQVSKESRQTAKKFRIIYDTWKFRAGGNVNR